MIILLLSSVVFLAIGWYGHWLYYTARAGLPLTLIAMGCLWVVCWVLTYPGRD